MDWDKKDEIIAPKWLTLRKKALLLQKDFIDDTTIPYHTTVEAQVWQ